jgi:surfeit locus 1 family protein
MRGTRWGLHIATLTGLATLIALGTWQLQRLAWKEGLIASIETRMKAAPERLSAVEEKFKALGDVDYLPVTFAGTVLNEHEQYFLSTHDGQSGWNIYAPLQLADGRALMLNRGFVPYDLRDPAKRAGSWPEGIQTINGLARNPLAGKPSSITPENDVKSNTWYWKDLNGMAANAGIAADRLLPFFVDDWSEGKPAALPVTRTTIVSLPNNHLQYALTWYGLAAALAGVWGGLVRRRASSPPSNDGGEVAREA